MKSASMLSPVWGTANGLVEVALDLHIKNYLWPEHVKQEGEACSLKHQPLSTSETDLLDALGSYRPESMRLADQQESSISIANISIECVSCSSKCKS